MRLKIALTLSCLEEFAALIPSVGWTSLHLRPAAHFNSVRWVPRRHQGIQMADRAFDGKEGGLTADEWEARRRLAQNLNFNIKPGDPLAPGPPQKGWEEEERDLSDAEIARRLQKALKKNRGAEREANRKIIDGWFQEGQEVMAKEVALRKEELAQAAPLLEARGREHAAVFESALLTDIDSKIRDFREKNNRLMAPLSSGAAAAGPALSRPDAIAADLEKLLSGGGSNGSVRVPPAQQQLPTQRPRPKESMRTEASINIGASTVTAGADASITGDNARAGMPAAMMATAGTALAAAGRMAGTADAFSVEADLVGFDSTVASPGSMLKEIVPTPADAGHIVVVGADGALGAALLARVREQQQPTAFGVPLAAVTGGGATLSADAKEALAAARTVIIAPDSDDGGGRGASSNGGGLGGAVGALFGGVARRTGGSGVGGGAVLTEKMVDVILDECGPALRHLVLLSSVGVDRAGVFPFSLQNVGGALDVVRGGEQAAVRRGARPGGPSFDYTVIRTGKLVTGAVAGKPAAQLLPGDQGTGETSRDAAVECLFQSLTQPAARNATASLLSSPSPPTAASSRPPKQGDWDDEFLRLDGPELLRIPLVDLMPSNPDPIRAGIFLREWSSLWTKPGSGLTTPVAVTATDRSVTILFRPTAKAYVSRKDEREQEEQQKSGGGSGRGGGSGGSNRREGGLQILVEDAPYPRIRVRRTPLDAGAVVKEMSEKAILDCLKKDLKALARD